LSTTKQSENDIELDKVTGRIDAEKKKSELIEIESENKKKEAMIEGESEALKIKTFFDTLGAGMARDEKIRIYNILRKEEYIEKLSRGNAKMYFTPSDINLSIETKDD
jgi:hypothetical protein